VTLLTIFLPKLYFLVVHLEYLTDGMLPLLKCFYTKFYKPSVKGEEEMWSSGILSALLVKDYIITALRVNNIGFIGTVLSQRMCH